MEWPKMISLEFEKLSASLRINKIQYIEFFIPDKVLNIGGG